jgi:hypothetical protein
VGVAYGGVHDASSMGPDGVGNMADVDGVDMFVVGLPLHKYLLYTHTISCRVLDHVWHSGNMQITIQDFSPNGAIEV